MSKNMSDNALGEMLIVNSSADLEGYVARYRGRFYNGYCCDLFKISEGEMALEFSRDGIMQILPESLFYDEQFLRNATDAEALKSRISELAAKREQITIFFEAFDNILERSQLELQKSIDLIECDKEAFVLKEMFDIDINRIRNPHVHKLARLMFDSDKVKGNINLIPFFVRSILGSNITCRRVKRVVDDVKSIYYSELQFIIYIEGLSSEEYRQRMDEYDEFFWYLEQWFLPFDCSVDFCIKDTHQTFILGEQMTLDYNIRFQ